MCLEIYELDPDRLLTPPKSPWQATLKNTKVELDCLTNIATLLMLEIDIKGG